ncbi:MAG: helix-turn-helix domain-containing protein [Defluviitaleaceae bacterium]|nr:helix-turn-helix domain-containing protein [Defluviitaleaceae bacterium]
MFRIGEFSKMSKTTVKTLRHYDKEGLLKPEEVDKFTSYRLYTTDQLIQLHRIQELRQIGISINEIGLILSGHDLDEILQKRKSELISELAHGQNQLSRIEFILKGEKTMNYSATIKELPGCIVYSKKIPLQYNVQHA